jgi:hypothetical protein
MTRRVECLHKLLEVSRHGSPQNMRGEI